MAADPIQVLTSQTNGSQRLDAGQLTLLAVHERLHLAADRRAFDRQYGLARQFARNRLYAGGLGRNQSGDADQASRDAVQDFCMRVKEAELKASQAMPLSMVALPDLIEHIANLNRRYEGPPEGTQVKASDAAGSPGPFVLSALKELTNRVLSSNPTSFATQARPWLPVEVNTVIQEALNRLSGFGYTVLVNCCASAVRLAQRHAAETFDDAAHHDNVHLHRQRAMSSVMSPHMRAIVARACAEGHEQVKNEWVANGKHVRNLPFLDALISSLSLLLDAPDEKPHALARRLLEAEGNFTDQEIHRGLTAASRHPIYQRVCKRIQRGDQWTH